MTVLHLDDRAEAFNARARHSGWTVECDRSLSFVRPELIELCALWRDRAKPYGIPPRSAFDARAIKTNIRNITIAERFAGSSGAWRYRFRIYSSALAEVTGSDKSGCILDEICKAPYLGMWTECYDTVLDRPRPLRFLIEYQMEPVSYLTGEILCAPMGDDPANPNMILSCVYLSPRKVCHGS